MIVAPVGVRTRMSLYGASLEGGGRQSVAWQIEPGSLREEALRALAAQEGLPARHLVRAALVAALHCLGRNMQVALALEAGDERLAASLFELPEGHVTFRDLLALPDHGDQLEAASQPVRLRFADSDRAFQVEIRCDGLDELHRHAFPHHLLCLLDGLLDDPSTPLHAIDLRTEHEREVTAAALQVAQGPWPGAWTLGELFEHRAAACPTSTAILFEGRSMSYEELNATANRVAHALKRRGAGPGRVVGLHARRGPETVAAMLGIAKAGAACLPLDPSYPPDRLAFMVTDAEACAVIAEPSLAPLPAPLVLHPDAFFHEPTDNPRATVSPDDLVYVIYTSGSTGTPKGVRTTHRALATWLAAMGAIGWVTPADRMLAHSSLCFDASVAEVHLPLVTGATVVLVSRETASDGPSLREHIESSGVTAMFATPVTWQMLLDAGWQGRRDFKAHCGGEAFSVALAAQLQERVGELWNVYGPTETTVYATAHHLRRLDDGLPIGRPLPGYRCQVVNPAGVPVPPGVPGELHIEGAAVADGYLNRPQLTAEKFAHQAPSLTRERLYRSGDLARLRSDGTLEIVGRIDGQVKLRGFRIEPGEIEAALERHGSVRRAVVALRGEAPAERRLVAWVTSSEKVDPVALRAFLEALLPAFMVPSRIVVVPTLPVTPSGKIDRQALVEPAQSAQPAEAVDAADTLAMPQDVVEFQLCKIFEEVLAVRPVGRHQDYFELGGTSLGVVRLLSRVERALGRRLSMMDVFAAPTPEKLAARLRAQEGWELRLSPLVPLQPKGSLAPFFFVHAFIGDICRGLTPHWPLDRPLYGIQARGVDGREEPLARVEDLAAAYIEEIEAVQPSGPYFIGGYCFGGVVAFEMARQWEQAGTQVDLVALVDATPPNLSPRQTLARLAQAPSALERLVRRVSRTPPQQLLQVVAEGVRSMLARRRLRSGQADPALLETVTRDVLRRMEGLEQWPEAYQKVARHNLMALLRYIPRPYGGALTLVHGRSVEPGRRDEPDDRGWSGLAASVCLHCIDAGHDQIMEEPHVRSVTEVLGHCLDVINHPPGGVTL